MAKKNPTSFIDAPKQKAEVIHSCIVNQADRLRVTTRVLRSSRILRNKLIWSRMILFKKIDLVQAKESRKTDLNLINLKYASVSGL